MSVIIHDGDALEVLRTLPDGMARCCATSPPYWGLRDYGAVGQLGLEPTPDAYVAAMVGVFREVRRVLADDGTLWLNLGDSYAGSWGAQSRPNGSDAGSTLDGGSMLSARQIEAHPRGTMTGSLKNTPVLKPKDLVGIPWMVAFALRADGWYLRSDIIWAKPNPMPESITDRPTKSHEYLFLLSKRARYYYDAAAIAEPVAQATIERLGQPTLADQAGSDRVPGKTNGPMKAVPPRFGGEKYGDSDAPEHRTKSGSEYRPQTARAYEIAREKGLTQDHIDAIRACGVSDVGKSLVTTNGAGKNTERMMALAAEAKAALGGYYREFLTNGARNRRTVWTVATQPFKEAHFATFPPALVEPCVKAGSAPGDVVLDPFSGAGTTGLVANRLGRKFVGIELNPKYAAMARRRIVADAPLLNQEIA